MKKKLAVLPCFGASAFAMEPVQAGARVFIKAGHGFDTYLAAALAAKQVPVVVVVADRDKAEYELIASAESEKPGWARTIFLKQSRSCEQASVKIVNIATGEVVFANAYNMTNAYHGKQSAAESCAEHLKQSCFGGAK